MARKVLPSRHVETLTLEQARGLSTRTTLYHMVRRNADGTAYRARVNGQVKTWKRNPARVRVPWTHGYNRGQEWGYVTEDNLDEWSLDDPTRAQEVTGEEHPS